MDPGNDQHVRLYQERGFSTEGRSRAEVHGDSVSELTEQVPSQQR